MKPDYGTLRRTRKSDGVTRKAVRRMASQGYSVREMALVLGISTQAVSKHIRALRVPEQELQPQQSEEAAV